LAEAAAARRVELARPRQPLVNRGEDLEDVSLLAIDGRALAGEAGAGADQISQRRRAEALEHLNEPGRGAWDAAGGGPDVERLLDLGVEVDRDRDQLGPALDPVEAGSGNEEVDQGRLAAAVDHHVAAGAEPRQRALDREGSEHRSDRGVDGVA